MIGAPAVGASPVSAHPPAGSTQNPGAVASIALAIVLLSFALTLDYPKAAHAFKGDEATYYSLGHSLARDFDFAFERKDLLRIWEEFSAPEGIFLKRGKTVQIRGSSSAPFVRRIKRTDPVRTRLYYAKAFIYPLAAAPFVFVWGTNGFLVLHAVLLTLDFFLAYTFIVARTRSEPAALAYAAVFLGASVIPVYAFWLTPELFNFSLVMYAFFLWTYKETGAALPETRVGRFLAGRGSDVAAAALIGILTFSKPTHAVLMFPLCMLALLRRQWGAMIGLAVVWLLVGGGLFGLNAVITGEFNYQGGDRKTFYSYTGFPYANERETFESISPNGVRAASLPSDVIINQHTGTVVAYNFLYFIVGRYAGLLPYFCPGLMCIVLFARSKTRPTWQWLTGVTILGAMLTFITLTPYTYSGGGGPIGNRYFMSFYPLFLFMVPPVLGLGSTAIALLVGAMFSAKILLNPLYSSFNPGEHAKSGPLRWLPIELTLLQDLPVSAQIERAKRLLGGTPQVLAYFPDDNAFNPEGEWFWMKGKTMTEVILRAPVVPAGEGQWIVKGIVSVTFEIQNGGRPDRVRISTGRESRTLDLKPEEVVRVSLPVRSGVPYQPQIQPTSYVYVVSISTTSGMVPFLEAPGSSDSRFLGARVHLVPEYVDMETATWSRAPE